MKYFVYILRSACDKKFYVGMTNNLKRRIGQHNQGQVQSTKSRIPLKLVLSEKVEDRTVAREREKYWKSGSGREKIRRMLKIEKKFGVADLPMGKS